MHEYRALTPFINAPAILFLQLSSPGTTSGVVKLIFFYDNNNSNNNINKTINERVVCDSFPPRSRTNYLCRILLLFSVTGSGARVSNIKIIVFFLFYIITIRKYSR